MDQAAESRGRQSLASGPLGMSAAFEGCEAIADAREAGKSEERITAVSSWQDAPYFSAAERAALALVEATVQPAPHGTERVSDALYAEVAKHYDEKALATLTIAIVQISFFIALAVIGKPQPVSSLAAEQWD